MKKIMISAIVLLIAFFTQSFNQSTSSVQKGKEVYEANCMSCHQEQGEGIAGAFPALAKTGNLTDKNKLVKIILQGMRGPITVKGVKYDGELASISLTDKETADVINYIRNSWGNKAAMISIADVAAAKKAVVKGYQPY
jgi:mono/diheme cytochrome c family protein